MLACSMIMVPYPLGTDQSQASIFFSEFWRPYIYAYGYQKSVLNIQIHISQQKTNTLNIHVTWSFYYAHITGTAIRYNNFEKNKCIAL